jgi:hypothetical protein
LRPGGSLILTAPFCSLSHFSPFHYSTGFNRYWYQTHLERTGLTVTEMTPNGNFYDYLAQEIRRLPSVTRRYCSRLVFVIALLGYFLIALPLLALLNILSWRDRGSSRILCFGYHVVAQKP